MADNNDHDERNVMLYFLAGVGVGSLIGAAAGILLAPRPGVETRHDLAIKLEELKHKASEWVKEKKQKGAAAVEQAADEAGA